MRRALGIVLVIAALLGLAGQAGAVASSPCTAAIEAAAPATVSMDCIEMMQDCGDSSVPCDRMTRACIVGTGCSGLFALAEAQPIVAVPIAGVTAPAWPATPALNGQSLQPELHPPCILA